MSTAFVEESSNLLNYLSKKNIKLSTCENNGKSVCDLIINEKPHFVIIDMFMPELDAIGIMRTTRAELKSFPVFAVCSSYSSPLLERELISEGATLFVVTPFECTSVVEKVISHAQSLGNKAKMSEEDATLYAQVTAMMQKLGVPSHVRGFQYLRESILLAYKNPSAVNYITKMLYPKIAEMFDVTDTRVERAIRNAVEATWERGDTRALFEFFPTRMRDDKKRPTNSEFIAVLADKIRIENYYLKNNPYYLRNI